MSGKGGKRRPEPKKPNPIIDLKATEVKSGSSASTASAAASQATSTGKPAAAPTATAEALSARAPAAKTASKPAASTTAASKPTSSTTSTSAASASSSATAAGARGAAASTKSGGGSGSGGGGNGRKTETPPPRKSGGGFFSTLTHMIAAIVGGALVLLFGEQVAQQAGLPLPKRTVEVPEEMKTRLAALEQSAAKSASAELPSDVSQQLAQVKTQSETIASLKETVAKLQSDQAALKASSGGTGEGGAAAASAELSEEVATRLKKLETTIETLSQATGEDGKGGGRLAQLATMSGKLADLETTLQTQLSTLRQSVMSDIDRRMTPTAKASEAARSGTQRVDRELAETKTEVARVSQRTEALGATADRIDEALRAIRQETGRLTSTVDGIKKDLKDQIAAVAKPEDVSAAVAPVAKKVAKLESGLEGVLSKEQSRQQDAERVVLSLQLANLKRAVERGGSFSDELASVKSAADGEVDLAPLESYANKGVPTASRLSAEFKSLSHDVIAATETKPNATFMDKMLAGARGIVRVRRTGETAGLDPNSTEAIVARIEQTLQKGDLTGAAQAAEKLSADAKKAASGWLDKLQARAAVESAIAKIEGQLKASLSGGRQSAETENKS